MRLVRTCLRSLLAVVAVLTVLVTGFGASTAVADPSSDLDDAKAKVERLEAEASAAGEDLEEAQLRHEQSQQRLDLLNEDIASQQQKVDDLAAQARQIALAEFQDRGVNTSVALFTDSDPDEFLNRLVTTSTVDSNMEATLAEYQSAQADLTDLKRSAEAEVAALATEQQHLDELKTNLDEKAKAAQDTVDELTEQARQELYSRSGIQASFNLSELDDEGVSARIRGAIAYATSKVGNSQYVWGAAGPNGFDCSGLMLAAYRSVGVSLPHSSRAQFGLGRPVSRADLKPGDLIFWYSPVHHVGMYIGNGKIVHARNTSVDLVIQTLDSYPAPFSGARRILG